jgi:hypothetical protein
VFCKTMDCLQRKKVEKSGWRPDTYTLQAARAVWVNIFRPERNERGNCVWEETGSLAELGEGKSGPGVGNVGVWDRGIGEEVMIIRLWSVNVLNIRWWHIRFSYRA